MQTDFERRFGGLRRLYGVAGAQQMFDAHVLVVGIGGVGSWAAEALARSGVGRITLVDMDHIAESNVNRQVHALDATLGQSKVLAMRERMLAINPNAQVVVIDDFVAVNNWLQIVHVNCRLPVKQRLLVKHKQALRAQIWLVMLKLVPN